MQKGAWGRREELRAGLATTKWAGKSLGETKSVINVTEKAPPGVWEPVFAMARRIFDGSVSSFAPSLQPHFRPASSSGCLHPSAYLTTLSWRLASGAKGSRRAPPFRSRATPEAARRPGGTGTPPTLPTLARTAPKPCTLGIGKRGTSRKPPARRRRKKRSVL